MYGIMDDAGGRTMTCGIIDGTGIEDGTHHRRQEVGISARKLARQESICIWGVPLGSEGILKLSSTCIQRPTCLLRLAQYIAAPLVHHTRPAVVPLSANSPVALLLQFESFLIISRHYSVVIMSTTNNDVVVEPSSRPRRGRIQATEDNPAG